MTSVAGRQCRRRIAINLFPTTRFHLHKRWKSFQAWEEAGTIPPEQVERVNGTPYKIREHGETSVPLPPMLDVNYETARTRHTQPKQRVASEERSPLAIELERNPFVKALTTPIRQCSLTRVRLPRHFLQPFSFRVEAAKAPHDVDNRPKMIIGPARVDAEHSDEVFGSHSWALLSRQVLDPLDRKERWRRLVLPSIRSVAGKRLGVSQKSLNANHMAWVGNTSSEVEGILHDRVHKIVDQILSKELPVYSGESRDRLDNVGLFVTLGAKELHAQALKNGVMHYSWTGRPSSAELCQRIAADGPQTFGTLYTARMLRLGAALDRLLAFNQVQSLLSQDAQAFASQALLQWMQSLKAESN